MHKILLALVMMFSHFIVYPEQGNALPNGILGINMHHMTPGCSTFIATPFVDRPGVWYNETVVEHCNMGDRGIESYVNYNFHGEPAYVLFFLVQEVDQNRQPIDDKTYKLEGWWWTGKTLPANPGPQSGVYQAEYTK